MPWTPEARKKIRELEDRFWEKAAWSRDETACWMWLGATDQRGYGRFSLKGTVAAHRLAYELERGEIPEDLELDHLCRNPGCVNPWHLEPVTGPENNSRSSSPTALNSRKTHCPQGHEYGPPRTEGGRTRRRCYPCKREEGARYRERKRNG